MFENVFELFGDSGLIRLKNPPASANGKQGSTNCSILPSWMGEQEHGVSWKNIENMKNINHVTLHL